MPRFITFGGCLTALALLSSLPAYAQTISIFADDEETILETLTVLAASEELRQALGVSTITAQDLERQPVGRDLAEIIRTMPGVNLTGSTSSGTFGQQRQIDLRGMGPENTLILIDGRPVLSRNSARMGRRGERDTSGDSNWVPAELIERIEVIRGPAAARYGSGAAGGVVNIITRQPTSQMMTVSTYLEVPENSDEGGTQRASIMIGGPVNDIFSYRLTASGQWTQPDSADINADAAADAIADGQPGAQQSAGREGKVQYNVGGLWSAQINSDHRLDFEANYSRQGNLFAGGIPNGNVGSITDGSVLDELLNANAETRLVERTTLSLTHFGTYDFGRSNSYVQWEHTNSRRLQENLSNPATEGNFTSTTDYVYTTLDNLTAKSEWDIPFFAMWNQTVTLGAEYRGEFLQAPISSDAMSGGEQDYMESHLLGLYLEDNILVTDQLTVTPGLRADIHSSFGLNFSPSLNASYQLTNEITIKAGIARAFKAPNLYQLSPDYEWNTDGMGCPVTAPSPCGIHGNPDLDPEISINKEIGIAYADQDGWAASLTYFHNDYENKITGGEVYNGLTTPGFNQMGAPITRNLLNWENSGPAVISGLEGSVTVPVLDTLTWTTNFTKVLETRREVDGFTVPVSLVPEHTINTALRWEPIEALGLTVSATHYGKIDASPITARLTEIPEDRQLDRDPYTVVNFSLDYNVNDNVQLSAGVRNLLDTRQFATGGAVANGQTPAQATSNANTFNEPGRTFYLGLTGSF